MCQIVFQLSVAHCGFYVVENKNFKNFFKELEFCSRKQLIYWLVSSDLFKLLSGVVRVHLGQWSSHHSHIPQLPQLPLLSSATDLNCLKTLVLCIS